ncbi:MAG: prepilin-type N-terminal cleavage/methylation domain-containing protein [Alphaproteobacteria bacterium]|nr:prepilin-type N-terminal cleavage/methylation domain-containing protein [Alphaproteobacteria bacterium]
MRRQGFTLIELSIVLVIIGLLVGGVMVGQSLIRASEMRSVITEINQYKSVFYAFRDKFNALPGDMRNAENFWGEIDPDPETCRTTLGTGTQTCNGDGNGKITGYPGGGTEVFRVWQHISNAQLLPVIYTGVTGPDSAHYDGELGKNIPASRISGTGYSIYYWGIQGVDFPNGQSWAVVYPGVQVIFPGIDYGNAIIFGQYVNNSFTTGATLTPNEAHSIDIKFDDGFAGKGKVTPFTNDFRDTNCTTTSDNSAEYDGSYDAIGCSLLFITGF